MKKRALVFVLTLITALAALGALANCGGGSATQFDKPANLAFDASTKTITFDGVSGASTYSYAVTKAGEESVLLEADDLSDNEISVASLGAGDYVVKIRANAEGNKTASDWAEKAFTVTAAVLPQLSAPTGLTRNGGVISWNTVSGAGAGYTLKVFEKSNPSNVKVDNVYVAVSAEPSYTMTAVFSAGVYTIEVYANAVEGSFRQSETAVADFTYTYPPLATPQNVIRSGFNTVAWDAVENAESYTVAVKDAVTGETVTGAGSANVTATSYALDFNLISSNCIIEVYANAVAGEYDGSAAGILNPFEMPEKLNPPQGLYSEDHEDGSILAWSAVSGAINGYLVKVYDASDDSLIKSYDAAAGVLSQIVNRADVPAGTECYAFVFAKAVTTGAESAWRFQSDASARADFTQQFPILAQPSVAFDEFSKKITWGAIDGAETYTVKVFKQGNPSAFITDTNVTNNFYDLSGTILNGGRTYSAEVEANATALALGSLKGQAGFTWRTWTFDDAGDLELFTVGVQANTTNQRAKLEVEAGRLKITNQPDPQQSNNVFFQLWFDLPAGTVITFDYTHGGGTFQAFGLKTNGYPIEGSHTDEGHVPETPAFAGSDSYWGELNLGGTGLKTITVVTSESKGIYLRIVGFGTSSVAYIDNIHISDSSKSQQSALTVNNPGSKTYGDAAFQLATSGGSGGGAVKYELISGPATVTPGGEVTITGVGDIVVRAKKGGDSVYNQTISANRTITAAKKGLTITGVTAANRDYNGATSVVLANGTLSGAVGGDDVSFTLGSGTIANANAGAGKAVTTDIQLTGGDAGKYTLTQPNYVTVTINKAAQAAPPALTCSTTATSITVTSSGDLEYKLGSGSWGTNDTFAGLTNGSTYVVYIRYAENTNYLASAEISESITLSSKNVGAAVTAPATVNGSPTTTSITVNAASLSSTNPGGQTLEYAIDTNSGAEPVSGWQPGLAFNGLDPNTTYYVWARSAENTNYYAGTAVASAGIKTAMAALAAPASLTVNQEGANVRKLTWSTVSNASNGYIVTITRVSDSAVIVNAAAVAAGTTSFELSDKNLGFNKNYNFSVIAAATANNLASPAAEVNNFKWMTLMFNDADDLRYFTTGETNASNHKTLISIVDGKLSITPDGDNMAFLTLWPEYTDNVNDLMDSSIPGGTAIIFDYNAMSTGKLIEAIACWPSNYLGSRGEPFNEGYRIVGGEAWSNITLGGTGTYTVTLASNANDVGSMTFRIQNLGNGNTVYLDNIYVKLPA